MTRLPCFRRLAVVLAGLLAASATGSGTPLRAAPADVDLERLREAMLRELERERGSVSAVLSRYAAVEAREIGSAGERYDLHRDLLERLRARDDRYLARHLRRVLRRPARTHFPAQVLALATLVGGKLPLERAQRVELLADAARDRTFRVSLWGLRLLGESRWPEAVDALIEILEDEEEAGRSGSALWHRASSELYRVLGAEAAQGTAASIRARWEAMDREVPEEPDYGRASETGRGRGATVVFFGNRIAPRSIFAIDTSSSMRQSARIGNREPERKVEIVRRELMRSLGGLQESFRFNILAYSSEWRAWRGDASELELHPATAEAVRSARQYAQNLETHTGTNIHDTLSAALDVRGAGTIYLLSDGEPSRGGGKKEILRTVRVKNYLRAVRLVTYGIVPEEGGSFDEDFLERLAAENFGWYRRVNKS